MQLHRPQSFRLLTRRHSIVVTLDGTSIPSKSSLNDGPMEERPPRTGAITFTPAGCERHVVIAPGDLNLLEIRLDPPFIADACGVQPIRWKPAFNADQPKIAALGRTLASTIERTDEADIVVETLMTAVARTMARQFAGIATRSGDGWMNPEALRRIVSTIEDDPASEHSLGSLAAANGLSVSALLRAFRGSVGATPGAFVLARRVARAEALLTSTELPLAAIADATGFGAPSHLVAAFRSSRGITPGQCRRDARGRAWRPDAATEDPGPDQTSTITLDP